eukprot:m.215702 g.215702  ORF g.215702 m.215702 type:complete len:178 (+) comp22206_c5_seq3:92-625(+)
MWAENGIWDESCVPPLGDLHMTLRCEECMALCFPEDLRQVGCLFCRRGDVPDARPGPWPLTIARDFISSLTCFQVHSNSLGLNMVHSVVAVKMGQHFELPGYGAVRSSGAHQRFLGPLHAAEGQHPRNAQTYFMAPETGQSKLIPPVEESPSPLHLGNHCWQPPQYSPKCCGTGFPL